MVVPKCFWNGEAVASEWWRGTTGPQLAPLSEALPETLRRAERRLGLLGKFCQAFHSLYSFECYCLMLLNILYAVIPPPLGLVTNIPIIKIPFISSPDFTPTRFSAWFPYLGIKTRGVKVQKRGVRGPGFVSHPLC